METFFTDTGRSAIIIGILYAVPLLFAGGISLYWIIFQRKHNAAIAIEAQRLVATSAARSASTYVQMEEAVRSMSDQLAQLEAARRSDHLQIMELQRVTTKLEQGIAALIAQLEAERMEPVWRPDPAMIVYATIDTARLKDLMVERFSNEELNDLLLRMGWDHEEIGGRSKSARVQEILERAASRHETPKLVTLLHQLRPQSRW